MSSVAALAGLSLIVIGESHMATPHYLMNPLHEQLTEQGAMVHSIGVCGASPSKWVNVGTTDCGRSDRVGKDAAVEVLGNSSTIAIKDVIAKDKPDALVVVIGDTVGSYEQPEYPKSWANQEVSTLTKLIKETGVKCYWVGPAWGQPKRFNKTPELVQRANAFLKENVAPCTYIDSTSFSQPGDWKTIDGQHFTSKYYNSWAEGIVNAIVSNPPKKTQ